MSANTYYLELMSILLNIFWLQKLMKKNHEGREPIFEKKKQEVLEKSLVVNLLELTQVMQKMAMIQTMKVVKYNYLSVNLKTKKKKKKTQ